MPSMENRSLSSIGVLDIGYWFIPRKTRDGSLMSARMPLLRMAWDVREQPEQMLGLRLEYKRLIARQKGPVWEVIPDRASTHWATITGLLEERRNMAYRCRPECHYCVTRWGRSASRHLHRSVRSMHRHVPWTSDYLSEHPPQEFSFRHQKG